MGCYLPCPKNLQNPYYLLLDFLQDEGLCLFSTLGTENEQDKSGMKLHMKGK